MSKRYTYLLSSVLLLFIFLFIMLSFYSRLATDDYYFIWDVRNHGIITGVTSQYMAWCGRFSATFFMDLFYKWFDINQSYYFLLPLVSFVLLVTGIYYLLNNIFRKYKITISILQKWLLSFSFVALLFFLSFDIAETWFWYCALSSYLWSIIAFVWGVAFLIETRKVFYSTTASLFCFIYVGGSSEIYSVIFGLALTVLLACQFRKHKNLKDFLKLSFSKKLLLVYIVLAIAFIIFLIAPGNYLRDGLFPKHEILRSFFIAAKSIVKFLVFYFPFKIFYIILFASPFLFLGNQLQSEKINYLTISFRQFFIRTTVFFAILFLIFFLMVAYVMVETGPPRVSFLLSFLLSVYCSILFFYLGYKAVFSIKNIDLIGFASACIGVILMTFFIIDQFTIVRKYSEANKMRIEQINSLNKTTQKDTLIILQKLPESGMVYSAEISSDTSHFTNRELRLGYNLKYHVAVNR
ncbi:MAG: DUF6056 family protein [Bacteroidia bacterium]